MFNVCLQFATFITWMYTLYKGPQYTLILPIFKALSIILLFHMVKDNFIFSFIMCVFLPMLSLMLGPSLGTHCRASVLYHKEAKVAVPVNIDAWCKPEGALRFSVDPSGWTHGQCNREAIHSPQAHWSLCWHSGFFLKGHSLFSSLH